MQVTWQWRLISVLQLSSYTAEIHIWELFHLLKDVFYWSSCIDPGFPGSLVDCIARSLISLSLTAIK